MPGRLPSFWIKVALALAVATAGEMLLFDAGGMGLNLGLWCLALLAALVLASPAVRRHRLAQIGLAAAAAFAALQIERATLVGWLLFALAIAVATLAPRAPKAQDGWRWAQRVVAAGVISLIGPFLDLRQLQRARGRARPVRLLHVAVAVALPIVGGVVFLWLFVAANPILEQALGSIQPPAPDVGRIVFFGLVGLIAWAVLRPRGLRRTLKTAGLDGELNLPGVTPVSVAASLALFNLIFLLQNGLDAVFLWSGVGLPKGVSFSEYAHRGAEPLIATALLAGLFVLVFLRPGSATAASRAIRALVVVWIVQNLFLVASTALRTLDYVEAYALTRTRIAALIWMGLVAVGLVLVTWRLLRAKSAGWLINANLAAAGVVLVLCSVVDLGAVAAAWNVRHAAEVGGKGVELDLHYFRELDGAGVVSLAELERRPALTPTFRCQVRSYRRQFEADMAARQADWRFWRWRDARRLDRVRALTGEAHPTAAQHEPPCPPANLPTPPLTPSPKPGT